MHVLSFRPRLSCMIYMASCISVLVFNILYIFADKYKGRALEERSLSFVGEISAQIERLKEAGEPEAAHYKRLRKELKNPEKLRAFEYSVLTVKQQRRRNTLRNICEACGAYFWSWQAYTVRGIRLSRLILPI